ncbi:hypothetical protein EHS25_005039 [Saitozyma podzolica]|uniref:NIPA-like protein 2 n=1 Tax=Saitozyma podzolica TaxID=1890683 RepID=A0A427Y2B1_9TREE|nr:hypothetical protein EHS25_005039 [Saitozyma podzolica]
MTPVSTSSLIGVAIACGGNVLISLALTVQKLAHRRQTEELHRKRKGEGDHHNGQGGVGVDGHEAGGAGGTLAVPVVLLPQQGGKGPPSHTRGIIAPAPIQPPTPSDPRGSPPPPSSVSVSPRTVPNGTAITIQSPSPVTRQLQSPRNDTALALGSEREDGAGVDLGNEEEEDEEDADDDEEGEVEEGAYLRSKLWWLGMLLISVGEGGNFLSYGFAPASVVAPLGTVALVANCLFAPLILRERFRPRELVGVALAILGAVTVVYASNDTNPRLDPAQLVAALRETPFIVYTVLNIALALLLIILSRSPRLGGRWIGIDVGVCALFGGYTVLSTKALSSFLSSMFLAAFAYPITWVLEVIPTQFVFFSLAAIVGSAVLYQEFRDETISRFVNFAFGIATTFLGVHLLTSYSSPPSHRKHPSRPIRSVPSLTVLPQVDEHTPLLVPATPRRDSVEQDVPAFSAGSLGRLRLTKRTSTGDFTPTLGISSQAGFLLMATTPPSGQAAFGNRARSMSRGGSGFPSGGTAGEEDEEQGGWNRRSSLPLPRA